jgi:hypothetical protein
VSLRPAVSPRHFDYSQVCGLDFCGATVHSREPVRRKVLDGVFVDLPQAPGDVDTRPVWHAMTLIIDRPNVFLMYFDPQTRKFEDLYVP